MLTKEVVKEYAHRKCDRLAFLQLEEKRLLSFWSKVIQSKKNPSDLIEEDNEDNDVSSPFEYFRTYPEALAKAKELYEAATCGDVASQFIQNNENLQEVSVLSMRYFALNYHNVKRADTPDGDIDQPALTNQESIERNTQKYLADPKVDVILEGQITIDGIRARFDALVRNGDSFELYEVKGTTSIFKKREAKIQRIKQPYLYDLAFQYAVYARAKLPIKSLGFVQINKDFLMTVPSYPLDDVDVMNFFEIITTIYLEDSVMPLKDYYHAKLYVDKDNDDVDFYIQHLQMLQDKNVEPPAYCKYRCRQGEWCPMLSECFPTVGPHSSIKITCNGSGGGSHHKLKKILDEEKIYEIKDIPCEMIDTGFPKIKRSKNSDVIKRNMCRLQIDYGQKIYTHKHNLEVGQIKDLLINDYSVFPLLFFDFESFMYPVPLVDNASPWKQICCQYSMHVVNKDYDLAKHDFNRGKGGGISHYEYIGNPSKDGYKSPEIGLIETLMEQLIKADICWQEGQFTVIVYNESFEKSRLKEMAEKYPKYSEFLLKFRDRVVDLYDFFVRGYWYNKDFNGSVSLKTTQPTLIKDPVIRSWYDYLPYNIYDTLNYKTGIIQNGQIALNVYQTLLRKMHSYGDMGDLHDKLIESLLHYCKIDSWGTVILYDIIVKAVEKIDKGELDLDVDLSNQLLSRQMV